MIQLEHFPGGYPFFPQGTSPNSTAQVVQELNRAGHAADLACLKRQLTTWKFKEKIPQKRWFDKKNVTPLKSVVIFGGYPMLKA